MTSEAHKWVETFPLLRATARVELLRSETTLTDLGAIEEHYRKRVRAAVQNSNPKPGDEFEVRIAGGAISVTLVAPSADREGGKQEEYLE
ncbi:MAG: hypothetical protein KDE27_11750 [Planctomycetes bacterium]|nr:hypothetical protein [Planctomycetota bacterium]